MLPQVYDAGSVFDPKVLDITDSDLESTVQLGIKRIAAACLALNYPTLASIPHSVVNGYKNVLAVSVETDYTFPLAEKVCAHPSLSSRLIRLLTGQHFCYQLVCLVGLALGLASVELLVVVSLLTLLQLPVWCKPCTSGCFYIDSSFSYCMAYIMSLS